MKILFVLEYYLPHIGGVEIVFKNLCEGLAKKGHKIKVITSRLPNTKRKEILNGVEIERILVPKFNSRYFFTLFAIPKVIKESKKYDLVHTTTFTGSLPAWIGAKINKKKVLITVHEVWVNLWKNVTKKSKTSAFIHNFLEKRIYNISFDKYACVSNSTKKELLKLKIPEKKVITVHNGMDYEQWNPKKYNGDKIRNKLNLKNKFVYFASGRPGTSKGFEYLIKAVPLIKKQIKNSRLVLILSKDKTYKKEYDKLINIIKELKIKEEVVILDPVPYSELPNYVIMADCVVIPSLSEGFGYTCVEACSLGKPVVASNTTSLPEVITGKGKLVEPGNEKEITSGVVSIFNKEYDKFPEKKFLWKDTIAKYEEIYGELK